MVDGRIKIDALRFHFYTLIVGHRPASFELWTAAKNHQTIKPVLHSLHLHAENAHGLQVKTWYRPHGTRARVRASAASTPTTAHCRLPPAHCPLLTSNTAPATPAPHATRRSGFAA